jgi:type I restriction enzyme S subunit
MGAAHTWPKSKVRYLADYINGTAFKPDDWSASGVPIIRIQNLTEPKVDFNYYNGSLAEKYRVRKGDILLPWSASPGVYIWNGPDAWLNQHIFRVVPNKNIVAPSYFYWLAKWFIPEMEHLLHGSTMQHFTWELFASFEVPLPSITEQYAISDFLDRKTAEADALVAKYERLVELLEEKRVALITQAVTKGLDSTAAMKDSGYAWIPSIPSHWSVLPLKHLTSIPITDGPHETPEFIPDGIPFVSAEAVSSGRIDFTKIRGYISVRDHQIYSRKYSPLRGDIFIIKSGATTGISAIVETDEIFDIWSPLAAVRCGPQALASYIFQVIRSKVFRDSIALHWNYGTQQNIGMSVLENLPVPLPPLPEQEQLVAFIENNIAKIEMTQASARAAIGLTKEHRSALITAAVTGQIDVDTYRSKKPAEVPA